jgi:hypothetical protein
MNDSTIRTDLTEGDLAFEVSDQALEAAAGATRDKAGAITLAFCSGLDTCPSGPVI